MSLSRKVAEIQIGPSDLTVRILCEFIMIAIVRQTWRLTNGLKALSEVSKMRIYTCPVAFLDEILIIALQIYIYNQITLLYAVIHEHQSWSVPTTESQIFSFNQV